MCAAAGDKHVVQTATAASVLKYGHDQRAPNRTLYFTASSAIASSASSSHRENAETAQQGHGGLVEVVVVGERVGEEAMRSKMLITSPDDDV